MAVTVPVTATGAVPLAAAFMVIGRVPVHMLLTAIGQVPVRVLLMATKRVPVRVLLTAPVGTRGTAAYGAGPAGLLRRIRGLLRGGHRPIIARTAEAPCSPRQK